MTTFRIWLPLLAALTLAAMPLRAEESVTSATGPDAAALTASSSPAAGQNTGLGAGQSATNNGAQNQAQDQSALPDAPEFAQNRPTEPTASDGKPAVIAPTFEVAPKPPTITPLTPGQKFRLFYRSRYDPYHFLTPAVSAGIGQANDSIPEYGQGAEGYGKRYVTYYADSTLAGFFGKFVLASVLHEDPRYFRQGTGGTKSRLIHAAKTAVITRKDDGSHTVNYANLLSSFIGAGISREYYPDEERGAGTTLSRGARHIYSASISAVLAEFWPDIRDKFKKKK